MSREGAQGAVAGQVPDGSQGGNGQATTTGTPQGDAGDQGTEEFVLSEETVHKLPPRERAIASRVLRLERENAELRASVARGDVDDGQDEASAAAALQRRESETKALLDKLIPEDGNELIAPGIKQLLGGLIRENEEIREILEQRAVAAKKDDQQDEFKRFKRANKGWEKFEDQMADVAKRLSVPLQTQEQFEELLDLVRGRTEKGRLEAELDASRKAGPVPSMRAPTSNLRERLSAARTGPKSRNVVESFNRHFPGAVKQAGQGQP